ncbi:MAG: hypothetical protein QS721_07240 [Candidatus Endonucleobacter sp. (ex Gigantidas childressi)]|nr:hypothetical protein [Candidatus Endonucleobacter sp. (ex Gigantidas childressi)]
MTINRVSETGKLMRHWQMHSGALVAIVELVTKYTVSAQVNSKSAADVTKATISLLNPFKDIVRTITASNGKEFSYHEKISQALLAEAYFAHPYSSWGVRVK